MPNSFLALTQEDENISARLSFIGATVRLKCNDVEVRQACFTEGFSFCWSWKIFVYELLVLVFGTINEKYVGFVVWFIGLI